MNSSEQFTMARESFMFYNVGPEEYRPKILRPPNPNCFWMDLDPIKYNLFYQFSLLMATDP